MRASIKGARLARVARRLPPSAECRDQVRAVPPLPNHRRGWEGKGTGAEPAGMVSFVTSLRLADGEGFYRGQDRYRAGTPEVLRITSS
jgi:hypothetical protein